MDLFLAAAGSQPDSGDLCGRWPGRSRLDADLFHQFRNKLPELAVTEHRRRGDGGEPPFDLGPLVGLARVGVALGEIAGVAGQHAVASAVLASPGERDEMVDAGLDLAARLLP